MQVPHALASAVATPSPLVSTNSSGGLPQASNRQWPRCLGIVLGMGGGSALCKCRCDEAVGTDEQLRVVVTKEGEGEGQGQRRPPIVSNGVHCALRVSQGVRPLPVGATGSGTTTVAANERAGGDVRSQ